MSHAQHQADMLESEIQPAGADSRPPGLPLTGGHQLGLEIEVDDGFFQKSEPAAIYTAARFRANRPEDYAECVKLIGQAVPAERIKRLLHIHHETVRAVGEREKLTIGVLKEQTKRGLLEAIDLAGATAALEFSKLSGLPRFIATGILIDKYAQLAGEPIQVNVNVTHHQGTDWSKVNQGPFADAIDVTPVAEPANPKSE